MFSRLKFRKQVVLPTEHGAWFWFLLPFIVGAVVAWRAGSVAPAATAAVGLTFIGGMAVFLCRQPFAVWHRVRRGRGSAANGRLALDWIIFFGITAAISLALLLWLGRHKQLILLWPTCILLILYLVAASRGRSGIRAWWMECLGAAGLALTLPAAWIAVQSDLTPTAWVLAAFMGLQNGLGVLYVRLRIADTHKQPRSTWPVWLFHTLGWLLLAIGSWQEWWPYLVLLPFTFYWLRAWWSVHQPRPVADVRRFGFTEAGITALSALLIIVAYY